MSQLRNRFPVIKPSVSASIRDIIGYLRESEHGKRSKLVCSSLNIVKLILEMTLAVLVRTVVERIKEINRYNGYAAKQQERQQLKMARLALGKGKALPWSRFNKHIVYDNQIIFLPVPLDLSTALLAGSISSIYQYCSIYTLLYFCSCNNGNRNALLKYKKL